MPWRNQLYPRLSMPLAGQLRALSVREAQTLEEIRIRLLCPAEFVFSDERRRMPFSPDRVAMDELVAALSGYALYAYERQMAQGYIPLPGGHRAGVCGRISLSEGNISRLCAVTSICIRIARLVEGASRQVQPFLLGENGRPLRVLLFGVPGCGKTTVLRDAALYLADVCGLKVAVADERDELFPADSEIMGCKVDVMHGAGKAQMMESLLRTMAPEVMITDEIGRSADAAAIEEMARCGVGLLASAHGASVQEVMCRPVLWQIAQTHALDRFVHLGQHGVCLGVYDGEGKRVGG